MTRHPVRGLLPVFLLALLAAPVACQAGAARADAPKRHALLIGIDRYACVSREQEQLQGADEDVERMALLLRACGFRIHTLPGSAAPTGANIRQALAALGAQAGAGDEVVFYFSGRGSVAKAVPEGDEGPEPTLVPADGLADSARADLRMGELEAWASDLNKKDVRLTLILDTCFTSPTARGEERAWKNVPRCLIRGRPVRPRGTLYRGAGLLLSPGNQAYEWQLDVDTNAWSGRSRTCGPTPPWPACRRIPTRSPPSARSSTRSAPFSSPAPVTCGVREPMPRAPRTALPSRFFP